MTGRGAVRSKMHLLGLAARVQGHLSKSRGVGALMPPEPCTEVCVRRGARAGLEAGAGGVWLLSGRPAPAGNEVWFCGNWVGPVHRAEEGGGPWLSQ